MRNKQQLDLSTENALLLEQHARLYQELRDTKELLSYAISFVERQSGAEHIGNLNFKRSHNVCGTANSFWINRKGEARDYDSMVLGSI